ncbi:hypothetical protein FP828_02215, partial [bacterium]|nr:hypothetical protein [bacterium]
AAVLFSGGADSMAAAVYYLSEGYAVRLLTYDNGAERNFENSRKSAGVIKKRFPGKASWALGESGALFKKTGIVNIAGDIKEYGDSLICCSCKLAMLAEAVIYCVKNNIKIIADGFNKNQLYYPEQLPEYIDITGILAARYGVKYEHPIYGLSRAKRDALLRSAEIRTAPSQASCLFAFNRVRNERVGEYTLSKMPMAVRYINKKLAEGKSVIKTRVRKKAKRRLGV